MVQQRMPFSKQLQRGVNNSESFGTLRWNKPVFQSFQLRPWSKEAEMEEPLSNSLGIYGPQIQSELSRAKSVPVREKDLLLDRDDLRTAHSLASMSMRDLISLKPKTSLEAMPVRPPLSKTKQIPGRYFPKPTTCESTRVVSFNVFKRYKPPVRARTTATGNSKSLDTSNLPLESMSFLDAVPRPHRQSSPGFNKRIHRPKRQLLELPEIKSEVFAICFNPGGSSRRGAEEHNGQGEGEKPTKPTYDPNSELHSDYYTIKRVSLNTPSVSSRGTSSKAFSVVLRGQPKLLHPKLVFSSLDSEGQPDCHQKAVAHSVTSSAPDFHAKVVEDSEKLADHTSLKHSGSDSGKIQVKIDSGLLPIAVS